jgi:hypothetical protein
LVTTAGSAIVRDGQPPASHGFLRSVVGFSSSDLRDLTQGRVAIHTLDTEDDREIAIAGAVRVAVSPQQYIAALRDIVDFKRHEAVVQIGVFGRPPQVSDMAGLTLDADHVSDLRDCRVLNCDLQLSRAAISRMRALNPRSPDFAPAATRVMREILTELVTEYYQTGDAALMTYENDRPPLKVADEFRAMVAAPPALLREFPVLEQRLTRFPAGDAPGVEDLIYWSKEDIGPKVIISVTHLSILEVVGDGPVVFAAGSKQIYGSHYFDASLGMTLLLRDEHPGSTVLLYVNRSRVDALDGLLGGIKRTIVRSRGRSAMAETLMRLRTRLPARVTGRR